MTVLVKFEAAKRALAEAKTIDEIKHIRDQSEALRLYVRQQRMGLEMQNDIAEIKLRAERRAGELLGEMGLQCGNPLWSHDATIAKPKLKDLGISKSQSGRWQLEASVPPEVFEQHVARTKVRKQELTSVGLQKLAKKLNRKQRKAGEGPFTLPDSIDIQVGDFRELSSQIADNSIDLILTDPPYAEEFLPLWSDLGRVAARVLKSSGFLVSYSGSMFLPQVIKSLGEHLEYYWQIGLYHPGAQCRVWPRHVLEAMKPILIYQKSPRRRTNNFFMNLLKSPAPSKDLHDWGQSIEPVRYLLDKFSKLDDLVYDPFLGSGTTGIACLQSARRFIGHEIDPDTAQIAMGRAAQATRRC